MYQDITKDQFKLKQVNILNSGSEFKLIWEVIHEDESTYKTTHSTHDYHFNNCKVKELIEKLNSHAKAINKQNKNLYVIISKLHIDELGNDKKQILFKVDYEYISADESHKISMNKIILENEIYNKSDEVKAIIGQIKENAFQFVIKNKRFKREHMELTLSGNRLES